MNSTYKISVIIPVYNAEKYLEKCINSILNQTYNNIEIILINDGSIDKSPNICKKYKEHYKNIIFINNKDNRGVSYTRNMGIKEATGDYIMFVDSDDYINEDYIEKISKNINIDNTIDMVISGYTFIDGNKKKTVSTDKFGILNKEEFLEEYINLKNKNLINIQCNKLTKSEIVKKEKVNEEYVSGEDLLFNLDLLANCKKIELSDETGYIYIINDTSVSKKIKESYTLHYEVENMNKMVALEKSKLYKMGLQKNVIENMYANSYYRMFNIACRNIALNQVSIKEKKIKYKKLLKDEQFNKYIRLKKDRNKKEQIEYIVYKMQSSILLLVYGFALKNKHR